jgi:hypothetical protein
MAWAIAALLKPKALLVAENLCLRQQPVVLQRRQPRPRLLGAGDGFEMAPRGLEGLLALALKAPADRRP